MKQSTIVGTFAIALMYSMNLMGSEATIWQGFGHEWQRKAFGQFSTPHRISVLSSLIGEDGQSMKIGQSPGVDGDYMMAKGYIEKIAVDGVRFQYKILDLEFNDEVMSVKPEPILNQNKKTATFDYDPTQGNLVSAVMGGFHIESQCIATAENECNSNGFWPYQLSFDVDQCQIQEQKIVCPVTTKIGRSWTPNQGGLPYIDNKPFNFKMNFKVKVGVLLAQAPAELFQATRIEWASRFKNGRKQGIETQNMGAALKGYPLESMAFGFHHMSFVFEGRRGNQPGRYIGGMAMNAQRTNLNDVQFQGGISFPRTVNNTPIGWEIGVTTWAFAPESNFQVTETRTVDAPICVESRNAPFYSQWEKCTELGYPVNQEMIDVSLL